MKTKENTAFPLKKKNIGIITIGIIVILSGNILLAGEDFIDARNFSMALYVAPFVLLAGVIIILFGILYSPKEENTK